MSVKNDDTEVKNVVNNSIILTKLIQRQNYYTREVGVEFCKPSPFPLKIVFRQSSRKERKVWKKTINMSLFCL